MVLMLMSIPAMAQEEEAALPDPGIAPDSFLYFLDVAMDNLALAMTFNNDAKIEKQLEIAEERLAEARAMAKKGDIDAMQESANEHGKTLGKLKVELKDIAYGDSEDELKKLIKIQHKIWKHSNKIENVKDELQIKIEVEENITAKQELIDFILASLEGQTGEVEIAIKNEKIKTKIMIGIETGKNGEEIEKEMEDELGITEEIQKHALEKINKAQDNLNEIQDEYAKMNVTPSGSMVDGINELIKQSRAAFDATNFEEAEELVEQAEDLIEELKDELKAPKTDDKNNIKENSYMETSNDTVSDEVHSEDGTDSDTKSDEMHNKDEPDVKSHEHI